MVLCCFSTCFSSPSPTIFLYFFFLSLSRLTPSSSCMCLSSSSSCFCLLFFLIFFVSSLLLFLLLSSFFFYFCFFFWLTSSPFLLLPSLIDCLWLADCSFGRHLSGCSRLPAIARPKVAMKSIAGTCVKPRATSLALKRIGYLGDHALFGVPTCRL